MYVCNYSPVSVRIVGVLSEELGRGVRGVGRRLRWPAPGAGVLGAGVQGSGAACRGERAGESTGERTRENTRENKERAQGEQKGEHK